MNEEPLDELVALYRQGARERTSPQMDGRVLAASEHAAAAQRLRGWGVRIGAVAASVALVLIAIHGHASRQRTSAAASLAVPASAIDPTRAYLERMDTTPGLSSTQQYLLVESHAPY